MKKGKIYCIPNAPHQNGDLWVSVLDNIVTVMNPAGKWWRDRTFPIEEFKEILKSAKKS